MEKDMGTPGDGIQANGVDIVNSSDIGGGWQLAWKWSERVGKDNEKGGYKRIYLHQQDGVSVSRRGSVMSLAGGGEECDYIHVAALVTQPSIYTKQLTYEHTTRPEGSHPSPKGPSWRDLFEPGVKHALFVGVGLQVLQQFSGINAVLYYTPQILDQAGIGVLLSNLGLASNSASLLKL